MKTTIYYNAKTTKLSMNDEGKSAAIFNHCSPETGHAVHHMEFDSTIDALDEISRKVFGCATDDLDTDDLPFGWDGIIKNYLTGSSTADELRKYANVWKVSSKLRGELNAEASRRDRLSKLLRDFLRDN